MPVALPRCVVIAIVLAGFSSAGTFAKPEHFALDRVHTRIMFTVDHSGFSKSIGTFSGANGTLDFDNDNWQQSKVEIAIPLDGLDMGNAKWKDKVLGGNLLDASKQPIARFVSTSIEPSGKDRALIHGTLSLRGQDTSIVLDAHLNALKRALTFKRTIGFSATATLSRKALGMDAYPDAIGDAVVVQIEMEAEAAKPAETQPVPVGDSKDAAGSNR